jgi:poly-gamma-glutamate capsule biosynthesis protein CapA/YwtB (metallophosphatase superfamily)
LFNSPDAIAVALENADFDLVVTANNHILDRCYKGALRTLEGASLDTTGCYSSPEAQNSPLIKTIHRQQPTDQQKDLAKKLLEAGADVILGIVIFPIS